MCIQSTECGAWGSEGPCELPPPFRSKCRLARGCHRQCWDPKGCEKIVSVSWEVASDILCLRASNQGSLCPHALTPETYSLSLLLLDSYTHYFKQQFTPPLLYLGVSLVAQAVKNLPAIQETQVPSLGREDLLEKEMATHSSIVPRESHGQRGLAGCSPWGCKE